MVRMIRSRLAAVYPAQSDNEELLKEQWSTLTRMIPLLYFVLLANSWGLSVTFWNSAPPVLTVVLPLMLTGMCGRRLAIWWGRKGIPLTIDEVRRELPRTNRLAIVLGILMCSWSFAVFPYGDAYEKAHVAFYLAITMLACILCLTQLRSAMLNVAAIGGTAFLGYFAFSDILPLVIMAASFFPVVIATAFIGLIQNRDFARMVDARTESRREQEKQSRLLRMIDDMPVAVMTVDPDTLKVNYANETSKALIRQIEHLLPFEADDLIGTPIAIFHSHLEARQRILANPANLPHHARVQFGPEVLDLKISAIVSRDGGYLGPMLSWALVTKEIEAENRIRHLAHYDTLTALPNRTTFHEEMECRLTAPGHRVGLLYVDLDGFKLVNDTRGHGIGDLLLVEVAKRLRAVCDAPGTLVSRLGGDEFAVLLPYTDAEKAQVHADRIIKAVSANYDFGYGNIAIGASIGIALAPDHGDSAGDLLARADIALYAAKEAGKGNARLFAASMESRIQERVHLETKLREALRDRDSLFVFYQPIVSIETGEVTAREALVRWHHPLRGWISPAEFVPVAEQCGLADALGAFVLETACREAARWQDHARIAVNISATQLGKGTLHDYVLTALVGSGLSPNRLEIEITETALLDHEHDIIGDLRRIRGLGVRVALDDFGTGYSSLAHLRAFPFDTIKIDGSFVKDAVNRPDCAAVVRAVADLGKRLGVTTVAEGVETEEQLDCLRNEGCIEFQGYLFGHPSPSSDDASRIERIDRDRQGIEAA
jgi:diguanylate cyclase (GGDEF)-like protein